MPFVAIVAPLISALFDYFSKEWFNGYEFGFELLLLNAALTMLGLLLFSQKK